MTETRRCNQCWHDKPLSAFRGRYKRLVKNCDSCRDRFRRGERAGRSPDLDTPGPTRVLFRRVSYVGKLGGIPASTTSGHTCPTSCSLRGNGCYAEFGKGASWWRALSRNSDPPRGRDPVGLSWDAFIEEVKALPVGQLWRHNVAGDLPGHGDVIDTARLVELVMANLLARARGFTFTHKPMRLPRNRDAVSGANRYGFTVNLSADSVAAADRLAAEGAGPVAVVLAHDAPDRSLTPAGRRVFVCPAQRDERATCADCGWCQRAERDFIVGFRAHGQMRRRLGVVS